MIRPPRPHPAGELRSWGGPSGLSLCPHVDQRRGWLQAGQLRVSLERAVSQQTGWEFSGPEGVVQLVDPLPLQAHNRLAPQGGAPAGRKDGRENIQGHSSEAAHLTSLTGPQLKLRHVAASACWEVFVHCGQPRACCELAVSLHEGWAEHRTWPVLAGLEPRHSTALGEQRGVPTVCKERDVSSWFGRTLRYGMGVSFLCCIINYCKLSS